MSVRSALLEDARERAREWRRLGFKSIAERVEREAGELDDRLAEAEQKDESHDA